MRPSLFKPAGVGALLLVSAVGLGASTMPAASEVIYPWCVKYGGVNADAGTNCGFVNKPQCEATASGFGGFCYENPMYNPPMQRTRKQRRAY